MKLFRNDIEARFIDRPNRFVLVAEAGGSLLRAHCPNPGRLEEILHPGRTLIFERQNDPRRKTEYTLVGARYKGKIIPLYSSRANNAARVLALPILFPEAEEIVPEYRIGSSRFDFLIRSKGRRMVVEVKACTLCEYGRAMFPDAPSLRARRHVEELAALSGKTDAAGGSSGHVVFMVMHEDARSFTPNIHTDPDFAVTLASAAEKIGIYALSLHCRADGNAEIVNPALPIDMAPVDLALKDSGIYFLLITLSEDRELKAGALPLLQFKKGFYLYAGSAKKNLRRRTARHLRKRKKYHWHIDYLTGIASAVRAYPIFSCGSLECRLAADIEKISDDQVPGFGCSDCGCGSHLFYFAHNPMKREDFTDLLFRYRHIEGLNPKG